MMIALPRRIWERAAAFVFLLAMLLGGSSGSIGQESAPTAADSDVVEEIPVAEADPTPREMALAMLEDLHVLEATVEEAIDEARELRGDTREIKRLEILDIVEDLNEVADGLVEQISKLDSLEIETIQPLAEEAMRYPPDLYLRAIEHLRGRLAAVRRDDPDAPPEKRARAELEAVGIHERFDQYLEGAIVTTERLGRIGADVDDLWERVDDALIERAKSLAARIRIHGSERDNLKSKARLKKPGQVDDAADVQLETANRRIDQLVSRLKVTSSLMKRRGLDASSYDTLIIDITGVVTEDILNPDVIRSLIQDGYQDTIRWFGRNGPTLLFQLVLIVLWILLARLVFWVGWALFLVLARPAVLLRELLRGLVRPTATLTGLLAGLWFIGVNPTTLLAGVGVMGVIVGLALQDSLGNLAAGIFILLYRPYEVDEIVQAGGVVGHVKAMGLANTTIVTFDRRRLYVPNRKIWSEVIENRSAEPFRRIEATVRVRYDNDVEGTIAYLKEVMRSHKLVVETPVTEVFVSKLADSWIEISVWPWATAKNWWSLSTALSKDLRRAMDSKGIEHPVPTNEVQVVERTSSSGGEASST